MKILRIKLENIKSYENGPVIDLHEGVNFISGKNGCGKTTLLESIGYGIFDFCKYSNVSKMLREGTKSGKVVVWFAFDDDLVYRSERKINSASSTWTIYEESDETEIVSGSRETLSWIKEMMGLSEEVNTSQMYSDIIGVSQGEITTYFKLSSEAKRKDHFNPMIGVEDYKKAFSQTSSIPANIKSQMQEIGSQIAQIKAKTEKYPEKKEQFEKLKKDHKKILGNICDKDKEFKEKQNKLKEKENTRDELVNKENELKILKESINNYENNKIKSKESVLESEKAYSIITKSKNGYEAYNQATDRFEKLDKERKIKNDLEKNKNSLLTEIKTLETEISGTKKNDLQNEKRIKNSIGTENKKISEMSIPCKENDLKLKKIDSKIDSIKKLEEDYLEEIEDRIAALKNNAVNIENNDSQIKKKILKIETLKRQTAGLKNTGQIEKDIAGLKALIRSKENKLQTISDSIKSCDISTGCVCPILNEPCKAISKDVLSKKIKSLKIQQREVGEELLPLQKKLKDLENEKELLLSLKSKGNQIIEELGEIKAIEKQSKTLKLEIKLSKINSLIKDMLFKFKSVNISLTLKELKEEDSAIADLEQIYDISRKTIKSHEQNLNKERTEIEKIKTGYETKIGKSREIIRDCEEELEELESSKRELDIKIKKNVQTKNLLKEIEKKIRPLSNIDEEIARLDIIINSNKKNYESYKENIKLAEGIKRAQKQLEDVLVLLDKKMKDRDAVEKRVIILKKGYNEQDYLILKSACDSLMKERAMIESQLQQFERDNKSLLKEISEMETELAKIKSLDEENQKISETGKLIELIRKVLNEVGKPIAQRYLDSLSSSANMIYNTLSDDKVILTWESDYMIKLTDANGSREFTQLSGGEQMCAALSVQLALAKEFSKVGIAIFDEPTSNLDDTRRDFLSDTISKVKEEYGFSQLFIISHDATFSSLTEQEIHLEKVNGKTVLT